MNYRILHQAGIYHGISGLRVELRRLLEPDEDTRTEYILMAFYVNEDGKSEELLKSFEPVSLNSERVDDRYQVMLELSREFFKSLKSTHSSRYQSALSEDCLLLFTLQTSLVNLSAYVYYTICTWPTWKKEKCYFALLCYN